MLRAAELDIQVRVVSLDVQIDAKKGDLSDPRVISFWMDEIRKGRMGPDSAPHFDAAAAQDSPALRGQPSPR